MTRAQLHLVNNHLTTLILEGSQRLTEGQQALFEQLCTDSIYVVKDDFDQGLNERLWHVENMELAENDPFGVLQAGSEAPLLDDVGATAFLRSRLANFFPNRRASLQIRAQLPRIGSQVEVGFVIEKFQQNMAPVVAQSTSSITRGAESFGLAVRSPAVSGWNVISGGTGGTNRSAVTTQVAETGYASFLVAVNEQGETRLWVNGQHFNQFSRQTTMRVTLGHFLWLRGALAIDYIQAWQERTPL